MAKKPRSPEERGVFDESRTLDAKIFSMLQAEEISERQHHTVSGAEPDNA
jgi:hypothetical protein